MMNYIWVAMVVIAVLAGIFTGNVGAVQDSLFSFADQAVEIALGLIGTMAFFCGLMKVMEDAGLCEKMSKLLAPLLRWMFPGIPKGHSANSSISLYIASSILGLGNACTPLGIRAMQDLQTLNKTKNIATDAQTMVMAISTGSITILPTTAIAMRSAVQSEGAAEIVGPTILTTLCAAAVCVIMTKLLNKIKIFTYDYNIEKERAAGTLLINEEYIGDDPLELGAVAKSTDDTIKG